MCIIRRYLVLVALFFWQGGFTFYAGVVVPVGSSVLKSDRRQGFITRKVTHYLNLIGTVALVPLAWDTLAERDPARWRRRSRMSLWLIMALAQGLLFWLHAQMEPFLQERGGIVLDPEAFRPFHRLYLWTHTIQWLSCLVYIGLLLQAWSAVDGLGKVERRELEVSKG